MNYAIVGKMLSLMLAIVSGAFAICLVVGAAHAHYTLADFNYGPWIWCIVITCAIALLLYVPNRKGDNKMFRKEAMAVIGLGWMMVTLLGALPYLLVMKDCSIADALFESSSGLTTTGATVFGDLQSLPHSLLFWRSFSQWIGGLGVVVFFVALLSFLGAGAKILYSNEASAHSTELETSRIQVGVLRIFGVYIVLSVVCTLTYHILGMDWFDAACHMFTTISTAGFSTHDESIGYFNNPAIEWSCILFMAAGGTSFLMMLSLFRGHVRNRKDLSKYSEVYIFYSILIICALMVTAFRYFSGEGQLSEELIRGSFFQVTALLTTTGYTSENYELWAPSTHAILITLMIIGGCTGSTAGGLKIARIMVAIKLSLRQVERSFRSRLVKPIKAGGKTLDAQSIELTSNYLVLVSILCVICLLILSVMEHSVSLEGQISIVISTMFNIGPGFAEIGPNDNYGFLHPSTKVWLSLVMIMARLEFYAILALVIPSLWKRFS